MSKKILIIGLAVLIAVCGVSTYFHIKNKVESDNNKKMYETVAEEVSATEESETPTPTKAPVNPYTDDTPVGGGGIGGTGGTSGGNSQSYTTTMNPSANPDMVGWVKINDTVINYPVMQTKKIPDYYLNHDFYKNESVYGRRSPTTISITISTRMNPCTVVLMFRRIVMLTLPRIT